MMNSGPQEQALPVGIHTAYSMYTSLPTPIAVLIADDCTLEFQSDLPALSRVKTISGTVSTSPLRSAARSNPLTTTSSVAAVRVKVISEVRQ